MDDDAAFEDRVLEQGWFQGALIPWAGELARDISRVGVGGCDLLLDPGAPALPDRTPDGHFVLISQLCDLIRPTAEEPFAVAIPAGPWGEDHARSLPGRNSSRWYLIDDDPPLVATLTRPIVFPKHLLPDRQAGPPPMPTMRFATWCARRWRRTALPDPFVETIQRALRGALRRTRSQDPFLATACWRVEFLGLTGPNGAPNARLVVVYYEELTERVVFEEYVARVIERMERQLPKAEERFREENPSFAPYHLEPIDIVSTADLSVDAALNAPMLVFDDLSPETDDQEEDDEHAEIRDEEVF